MPPRDQAEEWRPIHGHEGYEASSLGRIRSLDRTVEFIGRWGPTIRRHHGKVLKLKNRDNGSGQIYQNFYADGGFYLQVNRAVCSAFHGGPPSPEHEAAHLDGDSLNNTAANLGWATPVENAAHKAIHGTDSAGEKNGTAKLKDADILAIFERYVAGEKTCDLAFSFKITETSILGIIGGRRWCHIETPLRAKAKARARINNQNARQENNRRRQIEAASRNAHA